MIKKYLQFVNESKTPPGENCEGCSRIELSKDEMDLFNEEPALSLLISNNLVSLFDNELYYYSDDYNTLKVLKGFLTNLK